MSTSKFYKPAPFDPARLRYELSGVAARPAAEPSSEEFLHEGRIERARDHLDDRQNRARFFNESIFGEPAWEMLVLLYAYNDQARFTVSKLIDRAGAAYSSGLRWLQYLEQSELISRRASTTDGRVQFVELTPTAHHLLDLYFSAGRATPR